MYALAGSYEPSRIDWLFNAIAKSGRVSTSDW